MIALCYIIFFECNPKFEWILVQYLEIWVKMMSQELWCYIFGYIWNTGLCIGSLMLSIRPLLVNNILTCIVIVAKSMKSFFTRWAIFLHERSCIGLIYCCKSNFMCVNLCKIMKSRWFLNHNIRYSYSIVQPFFYGFSAGINDLIVSIYANWICIE